MQEEIKVDVTNLNIRIDTFISGEIKELSRTYVQKLIKDGYVLVNGKQIKNNYKTILGDIILLNIPEAKGIDIVPEDIPLDIVYEDNDIILVNKPKGMVVHPGAGHYNGTLVNALMYHCKNNLSGINGILRPGIVHRIDKDTTGIIIACKNDMSHKAIAELLKSHSIVRRYRAIVNGVLQDDEGTIDKPIGRHPIDRKKNAVDAPKSKAAVTHYKVLERFKNHTYIECQLETGRTHQIRVHMAYINHPLLGDEIYGPKNKNPYHLQGQTLHAMVLGFNHPRTGQYMEFIADLPAYFSELLSKLPK